MDSTINLLLTDLLLPGGIGGLEIADQLTARFPHLKTLYMSGYADELLRREHSESERSLIPKPFTPAALAGKVLEVLHGP